ncbi:MAG: cation-transporting P-type ATPase [Candidatus Moranbacteria bacterium]|nr:cation-transporting P-type ATPase [Candidatus Moranbacteria bacterium]
MPKQKNKKIYNLTSDEAFERFRAGADGLSSDEAKARIKEYGQNIIKKKQDWKWLKLVVGQFNDALVWILLVAAGLSFLFGELRDVTIILAIVFLNAVIGFFQEFKAERILDSIRKFATDKAVVFRDGEKKEIDRKMVIPGDVVFVTSGDSVPADGYLLEDYDLKVNSFIFTGESKPRKKESGAIDEEGLALADMTNLVFMGETVATGEARFLVTGTGMDTELGHIAHMAENVSDDPTPLQKQMRVLGRNVTILSVFIGVVVLVGGQYFKMSLYKNFLFALALAVSVVPEGLPAAVSVALSFGMKKLLKFNVLAKKLNAVETLGSVSTICTDKTGTITRNELTVTKAVVNDEIIDLSGVGYEPLGDFYSSGKKIDPKKTDNLEMLFRIGTLCNDASLVKEGSSYKILGDPTEGAMIVAGKKFDSEEKYYEIGEKKITENPFSSERMRMSVVYKNSKTMSYAKGSPDVMIGLSTHKKIGNEISLFTEEEKAKTREIYNSMSASALRVLAFAYRDLGDGFDEKKDMDKTEKDLVWVGMMAMIDPPRADVGSAISECVNLGIKVIMITGDYEVTARAIAEKIGLVKSEKNKEVVINGRTLDTLSDKNVYTSIKNGTCVFARIAPEQKLRIAGILKKYGETIAMTGDGVNDAPALKRADIGVAMGMIGTDVSKEASDMILMDDNFASIVKGIREGRTIFQNLKKFVHYVFTSNASELFTVVFGVLLQIPSPISAIQILAVDLGTDVFPSFALGLEPEEPGMSKTKLNSKRSIMGLSGFRRIFYLGIIMAVGAVTAFLWSMLRGGWHFGQSIADNDLLYVKSTTAAYAVLSMTQMANLLQSRSEKLSPFKLGFFKNKYAVGSVFISVTILILFMHLPVLQKYLHMSPIDWKDWMVVFGSFLAVFFWEEMRKDNGKTKQKGV